MLSTTLKKQFLFLFCVHMANRTIKNSTMSCLFSYFKYDQQQKKIHLKQNKIIMFSRSFHLILFCFTNNLLKKSRFVKPGENKINNNHEEYKLSCVCATNFSVHYIKKKKKFHKVAFKMIVDVLWEKNCYFKQVIRVA